MGHLTEKRDYNLASVIKLSYVLCYDCLTIVNVVMSRTWLCHYHQYIIPYLIFAKMYIVFAQLCNFGPY